jgi:hypothetical protein
MKIKYITLAALLAAGITACDKVGSSADSEEILRLDKDLYNYKNLSEVERSRMRDSLNAPIKALSQVLEFDTLCDESLLAWSSSMPVEVFSPMADTAFVKINDIEKKLGATLANAQNLGLELPHRKYVAVVWGRPESIVFNDSVALIALNHYLGANSPAYEHWPSYKRMLKRKDMLVYDVAEATVATEYPYQANEDNNTVLSHMLYEGALAYIKMQIVPDAKLSNALGLSEQQMQDTESNLSFMWGKMAAEQMLYSTDIDLIERLFAQLPYSSPISPKAPGRCVRLLGYKIVQSYVKHNKNVPLAQLLSPGFYASKQTLSDAKFSPAN